MAFTRPKLMTISLAGDTQGIYNMLYVPLPSFGYTVELRKGLNIQRFGQTVETFDRGRDYDKRICSFKILVPTTGDTGEQPGYGVRNFFEPQAARNYYADRYIMRLPANSGFFAAGPDKPDSGDFIFSLVENIKYSEMYTTPFQMAEVTFKIMFHDIPYKTLSQGAKDFGGAFGIGDVSGIRDPKIAPVQEQAASYTTTLGADNYALRAPSDEFSTNLSIATTTEKMAEIMNFVANNRGDAFDIRVGRNTAIFGAMTPDELINRTYRTKLLESIFIMTHTNYNLWTLPVELWWDRGAVA